MTEDNLNTGAVSDRSPSSEELQDYSDFISAEIRALSRPLPTVLWHYTSGDGLIGIISSGSLWSTQVACLNDSKELRYAADLLLAELEPHRLNAASPDFSGKAVLMERLFDGLRVDPAATSEWFVACLSEVRDDLSQWRGYGGGEGGYSIGFDCRHLAHAASGASAMLAPVCYDESIHQEIAGRVASATVEFYLRGLVLRSANSEQDWADAFLAAWRDHVVYLAPVLKHPAFAVEREWRLLRRLRAVDRRDMRYRQRGSLLARHLPLHLEHPLVPNSDLMPLQEIVVGPSRHAQVGIVGVGDLLLTHGYAEGGVRVSASLIPFQAP